MEKIKVYELDFGDTNLIEQNPLNILEWIKADMHALMKGEQEELCYTITVKEMTQEEYENLPDWA